ncbi:MAG: 2-C-methyl-D-erythritol 4-phosphate cytidylyltransferase [Clostridia bacterium]|nr:2-C-methyl-D-erythritol 4-phosphate cytidylyltransferase [Clostridia bacterium]MDY5556085.1 2-C-methyl-D-erythritol 4-phosphate cytidylyltransferase [Blautia sp.]
MSSVYGVILAGGIGSRMGNVEKPKQFLELGGKPVIIHTIEKFVVHPGLDKILVLSPRAWVSYTQDIIRKYIPSSSDRVVVLSGGETRNETIMNAIRYIDKEGMLDEDTIIVTHDSVRPFVTHRIIEENIQYAKKYGACDTVIPATDTIVESKDNSKITDIPNRKFMYQGQTPQSFRAKMLKDMYESLSDGEREILTDACKIMVLKGQHVHLVQGETFNIKITYPYDMTVAKALLNTEDKKC